MAATPAATPEGFRYLPGFVAPDAQRTLVAALRGLVAAAPLYRPTMPKSARPFSVRMTNAGSHGWFSDREGYRYLPRHPATGQPWPPIPDALLALWRAVAGYAADPQCCLVNHSPPGARMGLHLAADQQNFAAPGCSLSLGDGAVLRHGRGPRRRPADWWTAM